MSVNGKLLGPAMNALQHSTNHQSLLIPHKHAQVGYDFLKEAYSVSSCKPYNPRDEVFISYGDFDNDACLQLYGFVEQDNQYDKCVCWLVCVWF